MFVNASQDVKQNIFDRLPALVKSRVSQTWNELDAYLATGVEEVTDPLKWWHERCSSFPHLSCMALDYLMIPGMWLLALWYIVLIYSTATSVDVERLFSKGHILLPHLRNRLSSQSIRALLCLGSWSLLGLVKDEDVKKVVALDEVQEEDSEGNIVLE